jgi:hypothetical protein
VLAIHFTRRREKLFNERTRWTNKIQKIVRTLFETMK